MIKEFNKFTSKFWPLTLIVYVAFILFILPFITGSVLFTGKMAEQEKTLAAKKAELEKKLRVRKIGIQGGKGSFNEMAAKNFMESLPNIDFKIVYLHTTENVLSALDKKQIDFGQFAVCNTLGGEVTESAAAMKKHSFEKICQIDLKVVHNLMISPSATIKDIDTVVAHPQALKQCKEHLAKKYPRLKQMSGEGDLIDPSTWAEKLGRGEIGKNYAVLGNKTLAKLNGLKIVEENMQDSDENYTTFFWVKK